MFITNKRNKHSPIDPKSDAYTKVCFVYIQVIANYRAQQTMKESFTFFDL